MTQSPVTIKSCTLRFQNLILNFIFEIPIICMMTSNGNISALLAICVVNSTVAVPGEFRVQRPVTRSFDVLFDLRLNKRLSKQSRGWWFDTLSCPLWRQCNGNNGLLNWNISSVTFIIAYGLYIFTPWPFGPKGYCRAPVCPRVRELYFVCTINATDFN